VPVLPVQVLPWLKVNPFLVLPSRIEEPAVSSAPPFSVFSVPPWMSALRTSTVPPLAVMFPPALFTVLGSSCAAPAACTCPTMCLIVKDKNSRLWVLASPVLYLQSRYAPEFLFIVCDQCQTRRHGMGGDPQIVVADHLTLRFQLGPNSAVDFGGCFG
jgi:hypothetical protein